MCPRKQIPSQYTHAATLLGVLAFGVLLLPSPGYSLFVRENVYAPNGPVSAVARSGNTIYMGGNFSLLGKASGAAATFHVATGIAQTPFPHVVGLVRAVHADGVGGWYIGGSFSSVQGQPRNNLAHVDAAGKLTPWNPNVNGVVEDIALSGNVLYAAGLFSTVGSSPRSYVAAIDRTTGMATSWYCHPNGFVTEIEMGAGAVYLGGAFTTVFGQPHQALAAVDPATAEPLPFPATTDVTGVTALTYSTFGALYYAVTTITGTGYQLRRYDPTGTLPFFGTHNPNGPIYSISVAPGGADLAIGGDFTSLNGGDPHQRLAVIQLATSDLLPYNPGVDGPVRAVVWDSQDRIVVGGSFGMVGGAPRRNLAMLQWAGSVSAWDPSCGDQVWALGRAGSVVCAGGDFSIVNAVPRSNLASIDATSGVPFDWSPSTDGAVEALLVSGSTLYVGGQFSVVNGTTRNRAASLDLLSGTLSGFDPNVDTTPGTTVRAFALDGSTLYLGGAFNFVGTSWRIGIASVNATTGGLLPWIASVSGSVNTITFIPGNVFAYPMVVIGGQFTFAGGQPRNNLAGVETVNGLATPWNPSANGPVYSMIVYPTPIGGIDHAYVGGAFTTMGGQARNGIADVAGTSAALPWNPSADGTVRSMLVSGSTIYVGGTFFNIGGQPRIRIAALDRNSGAATAWDPSALAGNGVYALLQNEGTIYAGGDFLLIAGTQQSYFAGISNGTVSAVGEDATPVPPAAPLALRATPNPFENSTKIHFTLRSEGETRVTVYDVSGRLVRELHKGWLQAGRHTIPWDGRDESGRPVASGIYLLGLKSRVGQIGSKIFRIR